MRVALLAAIYVTALGGMQIVPPRWTTLSSGVTVRLRGISAISDRVAWASGARGTILRTDDGGLTWVPRPIADAVPAAGTAANPAPPLDFRDIDAVDERTAYALSIGNGELSRIYKTTDAGAHWVAQYLNKDPKVFLDAMSFWDARHGIVVGDSVDGRFFLLLTSDGGRTWTRATGLPPALPNEGAFAASGSNLAVHGSKDVWLGTGAASQARVLRSHDRGRTWAVSPTPLTAGPSAGIFSIAFRDARHGIVVGGDYRKEQEAVDNCAVTDDGGLTWTLVKGLSGFRSAVAYFPAGRIRSLVAVGPAGADWSMDDGRTWTSLEGAGFDALSIARRGPLAWAAGAGGRIARLDK